MIQSRKEYKYYLKADRIANGWPESGSLASRLKEFIFPDPIKQFQIALRAVEFYANVGGGPISKLQKLWYLRRFRKLSVKLGFSIPENVFGPGLSIAHYGTIVVNQATRVGANCRLHTGVNIGSEAGHGNRAPVIGNNCYIGPGAKIFGAISIADGVAIGANAVVNKTVDQQGVSVVGIPAKVIGPVDTRLLVIPAAELAKSDFDISGILGKPAREVNEILRAEGFVKE